MKVTCNYNNKKLTTTLLFKIDSLEINCENQLKPKNYNNNLKKENQIFKNRKLKMMTYKNQKIKNKLRY